MQIAAVTTSRSLQLWGYRMRHSHSTGWEARIQIGRLWAPASFKFLMLSQYFVLTGKILLLNASLYAWRKVRPNHTWTSEFAANSDLQTQVYFRTMQGDGWLSSAQFSRSVVSNSLRPHEPQHARPPCPSPSPGVYPNSCPLSESVMPPSHLILCIPFSSCPQSLPASGYFQMSQLFASGGQSVGVSASTSVLPMKTQEWSPLRWTAWISLQPKGLCPLKLQFREGFQQSIFKGQVREEPGWLLQTSWPKNPLLLQLATKSAQDVSVNFQDKCYSLFCNFVSQYEWESVILLKVRAFRMGYSVYLRL